METRKHKLYDRPYLGAIVAIVITYVFIFFGSSMFVPLFRNYSSNISIIITSTSILISVIALVIHKLWFKKDNYKGFIAFSKSSNKEVWAIVIALIIIDVIVLLVKGISTGLAMPLLINLIPAISAGVFEETCYRTIPVSILMKNKPTYKRMVIATILTAVIFGVSHAINIVSGATILNTILQIVFAIGPGMFFAAVYLRTGSIIIPMVFHAFHDILELFIPRDGDMALLLSKNISLGELIPDIIFTILFVGAAIYLLRKSKWDEIKATWANIWAE